MSEDLHPHDGDAKPIQLEGETWAPPAEDDAAATSGGHNAFMGPDGLRAGWSITLFVLLFLAFAATASFIVSKTHHMPQRLDRSSGAPQMLPSFMIAAEGIVAGSTLLAAFVLSKIEKRRFAAYGLGALNAHRLPQFCKGLISGIAVVSLLVGTLWKLHLIVFDGINRDGAFHYGLLWLIGMLLVGVFEEFLFRGFILFSFARGFSQHGNGRDSFWIAAIISSAIFGGVHWNNTGESIIGVCSAALIGLVFSFSLWRTGSLWWAVGFHAAWNWGQSFVYGVGDSGLRSAGSLLRSHPEGNPLLSGGTVGPEGSLFVPLIIALAALIVQLTLKDEQWTTHQE